MGFDTIKSPSRPLYALLASSRRQTADGRRQTADAFRWYLGQFTPALDREVMCTMNVSGGTVPAVLISKQLNEAQT